MASKPQVHPGRQGGPRMSYASATVQDQFPKRDQALVCDNDPDINLTQYASAVAELLGNKKDILAIHYMTGNRVAIYLSSKEVLDKLISENSHIMIAEKEVTIRPLEAKTIRVLLQNVSPIVPHYLIENELDRANVVRAGPITMLRAGLSEDGFDHVTGSRRQFYIDPADRDKLPDMIKVVYEDINYYMYTSTDNIVKCYSCHKEGHLARNCPNTSEYSSRLAAMRSQNSDRGDQTLGSYISGVEKQPENINLSNELSTETLSQNYGAATSGSQSNDTLPADDSTSIAMDIEPDNSTANNEVQTTPILSDQKEEKNLMPPPVRGKRIRTKSASTASSDKCTRQTRKKTAVESKQNDAAQAITKEALQTFFSPAESLVKGNKHRFPLDLAEIITFIHETYTNENVTSLAKTYTNNIPALTDMLAEIHTVINNRNLKRRVNKIRQSIEDPGTIVDSSDSNSQEEEEGV